MSLVNELNSELAVTILNRTTPQSKPDGQAVREMLSEIHNTLRQLSQAGHERRKNRYKPAALTAENSSH